MAHVCEDDGTATTIVATLPHAARAPAAAPTQWPSRSHAVDPFRVGAPGPERAERRPADRLKPAA